MKVLLVHLSDIHVRAATETLERRAEALVSSVRNLDTEIDIAALLITGDIAYSGTDAEYLAALNIINRIKSALQDQLHFSRTPAPPVACICVAGNHDCDFGGDVEVRRIVAADVLKSACGSPTKSVVDICVSVQANFVNFRRTVEPTAAMPATSSDLAPVSYEYHVDFHGQSLRFVCLNTAWLSMKAERQGELCLPTEAVPTRKRGVALSIALLHHPYNWLGATQSREVRTRLESAADIVLTGHEHQSELRDVSTARTASMTYVEGGVFQDPASVSESAFNVLVVDTEQKRRRFFKLELQSDLYVVVNDTPFSQAGHGVDWESYARSEAAGAMFEPTAAWSKYLSDPGVTLQHRAKEVVSLEDIYVYPDLREKRLPGESDGRIVRSDRVIDLVEKTHCLLISGDSETGKTSLGKTLFQHFLRNEFVPVWLCADDGVPTGERVGGVLEAAFVRQYGAAWLNHYRQLDPSRCVIVIDDYDKVRARRDRRAQMLKTLWQRAHRIIILVDDLAFDIAQAFAESDSPETSEALAAADSSARSDGGQRIEMSIAHYRIQPFGHLLRNRLVGKWLALDGRDVSTADYVQHLEQITRLLDTIVGRHFVPAYPVFLLAILQATEAATPVDTSASTHGHFYEVFIKTALMKGRTLPEFDILMSFLSRVGWTMLRGRVTLLPEPAYEACQAEYETLKDVRISSRGALSALISSGVLTKDGRGVAFRYAYMRYYFAAAFMRDHIATADVQTQIKHLCDHLYVEDAANTLLFLAHLTKDPSVLRLLLEAAGRVYSDHEPSRMDEDVSFIGDHREDVLALDCPLPLPQGRDERLRSQDDTEAMESAAPRIGSWDTSPDDPLAQVSRALKAIQILGQFLKNFPGALDGNDKVTIANSCYDVGLRLLTAVHSTMRGSESMLAAEMARLIRMARPNIAEEELKKRSDAAVVSLGLLVCLGVVRRISMAAGADQLEGTYRQLLARQSSTAYRLIDVSIKLDRMGAFPEAGVYALAENLHLKPVPMWVLKALVREYFDLFPLAYDVRQRVCDKLGLPYDGSVGVMPRLIPRHTPRA